MAEENGNLGPKSRMPIYTVGALALVLCGIFGMWYTQAAKIDVIANTLDISAKQWTDAVNELKQMGQTYATKRELDAVGARIERIEKVADDKK